MKTTPLFILSSAFLGLAVSANAQSSFNAKSSTAAANVANASVVTTAADNPAPLPAPTVITSAPYTITASGYYQLGADLSVTATSGAIITVATSNVTLDLGGHFISGPKGVVTTSTLIGVSSYENNNVTVMNGTIANCYEGVIFATNNPATTINYNQTVQNLLVTNIGHIGINFQYTLYSRIMDCVVTNVGGATASNGSYNAGLYLQGTGSSASHNTIVNITGGSASPNNAEGIFIPSGYTALLVGNQIFSAYYGIYFSGTGKYEDNLTLGCTTPFTGGTAVGDNN